MHCAALAMELDGATDATLSLQYNSSGSTSRPSWGDPNKVAGSALMVPKAPGPPVAGLTRRLVCGASWQHSAPSVNHKNLEGCCMMCARDSPTAWPIILASHWNPAPGPLQLQAFRGELRLTLLHRGQPAGRVQCARGVML